MQNYFLLVYDVKYCVQEMLIPGNVMQWGLVFAAATEVFRYHNTAVLQVEYL